MPKRSSKDDQILAEARRLHANATERFQQKEAELREVAAELRAHTAHLESLMQVLSPATQNKSVVAGKAAKEAGQEKKSSDAPCIAMVPTLNVPCTYHEDSLIHDPNGGYPSYHPFEPGKPVVRAGRKSRARLAIANPSLAAENVSETAIAAGAGELGG